MQYVTQSLRLESSENEFKQMLRSLNTSKHSIFSAMVFAINHSESSNKVLEIITEHSLNDLAGLYLISDILYNCNKVDIQYSWSYLPLIEAKLPQLMQKFSHSGKALQVLQI